MKEYKYFYRAYDEHGQLFFSHRSNSAKRLLSLVKKESCASDGSMFALWYFARIEHNIPPYVEYRVACGDDL